MIIFQILCFGSIAGLGILFGVGLSVDKITNKYWLAYIVVALCFIVGFIGTIAYTSI